MIVLSDNDVILKLAQCNLLSHLPQIFNTQPQEIYINPAARFQLLKGTPEKLIKKYGSADIYERLGAFVQAVRDIPEVQNDALIQTLSCVQDIDAGEQQLLASCIENPGSIFMTGDKRCLAAVLANQPALVEIHQRLIDSVVTFESSLLLCIQSTNEQHVHTQLVANPKPDGVLRMALSNSGSSMCQCLFSCTREFYDYLAFKDRLPQRNWGL